MTTLRLIITFGNRETKIPLVEEQANQFFIDFNQRNNFECHVNVPQSRNIDIDPVYKAELYETDILLEYLNCGPKFHAGDLWKKIGPDWCDETKNKMSHLWLRLADRSDLINKAKQSHSDIDIKEIAFGTMPSMHHFMQHYHYETKQNDRKELMSTFLHNQRFFVLYACLTHNTDCNTRQRKTYKFVVYYKAISRIIVSQAPGKETVQLHFVLRHIPFVFIEKKSRNGNNEVVKESSRETLASDQEYQEKRWERSLEFGCRCNRSRCHINKIGRCLVFKVVIARRNRAFGIIERLIQRCSASTFIFYSNLKLEVPKPYLDQFDVFPNYTENINSGIDTNANDIKFQCQFSWNVLNGRSLEVHDKILLKQRTRHHADYWKIFTNTLRRISISITEQEAVINTFHHMSEFITRSEIFEFDVAFDCLFKHYYGITAKPADLPEGMCFVRRLIITPSRTICLAPSEHFDNRVIREFGSEHLLRVSIQDDNFSKLTYAVQHHTRRDKFLDEVARNLLNQKINIGPRLYEVLASSNSQLREHGLWLFSKDSLGRTAQDIRTWMGDFSSITNVAKYMARMGQCFSSSEEAVQIELKDEEVERAIDKKTKKEDFTFSDGIGMISSELAAEVRKDRSKLPLRIDESNPEYKPSAFQIRFKGCKGMVAENPNLEGRKLIIRPSMEKFQCKSTNLLEIVKISAPRGLFLNRPFISILEQLGVKANVFLKLQKEMVLELTDSLIYEKKAWKMMSRLTTLDYPYRRLLNAGISLTEEPFFRSLLLAVYKGAIDMLRAKARIEIPPDYGRNMLGVMDETGKLEYGQIFVQYSTELGYSESPTKVLEETVVVTKNPCMHPGDVRKFEAVDVPELHHIKDCIVFPSQGKRPHPDEMAGSDLDGDEYMVIWYKDLIFPRENFPAMDYPPNPVTVHSGKIQVRDMIDFLCMYIANENIGHLANAHLAWSDFHEEGIFSEVCIKIAQKFPQVLDFAKSGTTCYLKPNEKPRLYPDFMEKGTSNNSYKSPNALGLLYRVTRNLEACVSKIELTNQSISPDKSFEYDGWETYRESANFIMADYSKRIKNICKKYGLRNEVEALTGFAGKLDEYNDNRYERDNAISIAKTYIMDAVKRFRLKFYQSYNTECQSNISRSEIKEIQYRRASAWYMVTYTSTDKPVLSFPWIVHELLCEIREKNFRAKGIPLSLRKSSFIKSSDDKLLENYEPYANCLDGQCFCVMILESTVKDWMRQSALTLSRSAKETFCFTCFRNIVNTFLQSYTRNSCCYFEKPECDCQNMCSPIKLLLEFFKFYASEVKSNIGHCTASLQFGGECEGFRERNLQAIALRSYASLAIMRDTHYIGLNEHPSAILDDNANEEGDPIRVSVSEDFENLLTRHHDELLSELKSLSHVKDIFVTPDKDHRGEWYILVHSIGRGYQRWCLEELIMDENIVGVLKARLRLSSLRLT